MKKSENGGLQNAKALAHLCMGVSLIQNQNFVKAQKELQLSVKEYRNLIKQGYDLSLKLAEALLYLCICFDELQTLHDDVEDIYCEVFELLQSASEEGQTFSAMIPMIEKVARWYFTPQPPMKPNLLKAFKIASIGINWLDSVLTQVHRSTEVTLASRNLEFYQFAIKLALELGELEQAYTILERSKTRLLVELMQQEQIALPSNVPKEIREEYYNSRKKLNSSEWELIANPPAKERTLLLQKLKNEKQNFRKSLNKIAQHDPVFVELLQPQPLTRKDFTPLIDLDELVIAFEQCPEELRIYPITKRRGVQPVRRIQGLTQQCLKEAADRFNEGIKGKHVEVAKNIEDAKRAIDEVINWLTKQLVTDIEQLLALYNPQKLTLVPHQSWHLLPIHLLKVNNDYLVFKYKVRYLPSLKVLRMISDRESPTDGNGCIITVPNEKEDKLLIKRGIRETGKEIGKLRKQKSDFQDTFFSTEEEIKKLCEQEGFQDTFLSVEIATLKAVRSCLKEAKFIHFAGHGKFEKDLKSALLLDSKQELRALDLFQLRLSNPRLVMLGACETAQIQDSSTDEYMGLSAGFLFAGAHNVLATLWQVHAAATRSFTKENFYPRFFESKNSPLIEILQESQKEISCVPNYNHPYYWGAFVLIGDGK